MTAKHDFTESEWQLLRDSPYWVYFAFANAEAGAEQDEQQAREVEAFAATLAGYQSDNELIAAVLAAQDGQIEVNERATVAEALQALEQVRDILVRKGGREDLGEFRAFLLDIGQRVTEATEEAWFSLGGKVSLAEQTILGKIEAVLTDQERRTLSEIMKKKLTKHFHLLDLDQDGFVEREDWEQCGRNLAKIRDWQPGSPEYEDILAKQGYLWTTFWKPADGNNDGKVSLDEYLHLADRQRTGGYFAQDIVLQLFGAIFDMIDLDGDGKITVQDYQLYFKAWGLDENLAEQAFSRLDLSGDGRLSRSIFIQFGLNFYISDDPNERGNWLFGPYE